LNDASVGAAFCRPGPFENDKNRILNTIQKNGKTLVTDVLDYGGTVRKNGRDDVIL
jgi:altronate dehydratase